VHTGESDAQGLANGSFHGISSQELANLLPQIPKQIKVHVPSSSHCLAFRTTSCIELARQIERAGERESGREKGREREGRTSLLTGLEFPAGGASTEIAQSTFSI
jgi:hypothetical protein